MKNILIGNSSYIKFQSKYSVFGITSINFVVLFKIHILKFLFHENNLRKTYETLRYNVLYRCFIGYGIIEEISNHSTYSQN